LVGSNANEIDAGTLVLKVVVIKIGKYALSLKAFSVMVPPGIFAAGLQNPVAVTEEQKVSPSAY
jgi:hypothetical protein